jgi:hypothetical protein
MGNDYIAVMEVEYLLGQCRDEVDAAQKAEALLEELRNTDSDVNTATLLDIEEW